LVNPLAHRPRPTQLVIGKAAPEEEGKAGWRVPDYAHRIKPCATQDPGWILLDPEEE
jgi:hypothetical protein